ncbi:hypothetical protein TBLA_0C04420 [Henningerozyma blattae CBS 6284]|uniref:CCAAT-binding factor domain-containing protein n=1 Tax=Henningerozyma blattae (strain ATCC 34711 / CBS 6284 / DSM 70876 / NBRC 10599 / NRRL Y-10934 / UCD 77-7) TaxID=1071380 RepID=I2H1I7_HENB6|nr:hypothetical protein TBLA_0C04420 [Tetrapisispora blattae CBS 6284]CCH60239.1 hypothetical protein TBLA_0C04420 [Tetrapisispora blattae CBS 6284]
MILSNDEIKSIANSITKKSDKKNYNSIIKLINEFIKVDQFDELKSNLSLEQNQRFLLVSLFQIFKKLFTRYDLSLNTQVSTSKEQILFIKWCRKLYESFKTKILSFISKVQFHCSLTLDCLDTFIQLLNLESIFFSSSKDAALFPNKTFKKLIVALFQSIENKDIDSNGQSLNPLILEFSENYYQRFVDIQYYFQLEFNQLLVDEESPMTKLDPIMIMSKWLVIVNHDNHCCLENQSELEIYVENPPSTIENVSKYKSNIGKNWISLLGSTLSLDQYKTILLILHKRIIPLLHNPANLMDFLTDSCNINKTSFTDDKAEQESLSFIPILSLNGLFELMQKCNLNYPDFYTRLYQQLTPNLIHSKYKQRFFRLLDLFLSSSHLSGNLIASFIKKLSTLTLEAPPSSIIIIIPFIYNLLKKHPTCMILIHNPMFISSPFDDMEKVQNLKNLKNSYVDPFDTNESNPELTNAIDSSLWEIHSLINHYHPNISSLAKIFSQPFRKLNYNLEDFLDWNYKQLLDSESNRTLKVLPTLEFENFDKLFEDNQEPNNNMENNEENENSSIFLKSVAW